MTDKNGKLPKGWKWIKLGEVSNLLSGGTRSRNNSQSFIDVISWLKTLAAKILSKTIKAMRSVNYKLA